MPPSLRAIFLDAAGTLIHLREPVGETYARIAAAHGVHADPQSLEKAFRTAWKALPSPLHAQESPPEDDDRSWWRTLVAKTFETAVQQHLKEDDTFEHMFTAMYEHFANAHAWQLYEDTLPALRHLKAHDSIRLFVLSNFDRRLHSILNGLGVAHFFDGVILSSEVGASKPHLRMFAAALHAAAAPASWCLHIGDDARCDHDGATAAGMHAMLVDRPEVTLLTIAEKVAQGHFLLASPSKVTT